MGVSNSFVEKILTSPVHRILSGSTVLIRYRGRHTDTEYTTPVQFADALVGLVVLVGTPESKTWWRNFTEMGQVAVLVAGKWIPMTAHALRGDDDPEAVEPLLRSYAIRFPKIVKSLDGKTLEDRVHNAVVVWLRPA